MYTPEPLKTENIELPEDLSELIELLSRNIHDTWAAGRQKEGWTYGPQRNDNTKQTPCLVPYEELPEQEKDYDRNTVTQTIKTILLLGYEIKKNIN